MKYEMLELPEPGSTVIVGLSGGVDSTLTALLLKQRGCNVIGITMSMWDGHIQPIPDAVKPSCYSPDEEEDIEECRKFCKEQGIEYHVLDVSKEYNEKVIEYFKSEYRSGKTPNPCIRCNKEIKFGALLKGAEKLDIKFDYFCTGHYAMMVRPKEGIWNTDVKPAMISCATDDSKDQTYFLYRVSSSILEKVRFPMATLKKQEVFEIARKYGLEAAERKESQDFISDEYLEQLFSDKPSVPGDFIDENGKVLGKHKGIEHYTIGQRRGLGVAAAYPLYVKEIKNETNQIVLAQKEKLNSTSLIADNFVWPGDIEPTESFEALAKIRLRSKVEMGFVEKYTPDESDTHQYIGQPYKITFNQGQYAVTPGQSVVLYKDSVIIGGGVIVK